MRYSTLALCSGAMLWLIRCSSTSTNQTGQGDAGWDAAGTGSGGLAASGGTSGTAGDSGPDVSLGGSGGLAASGGVGGQSGAGGVAGAAGASTGGAAGGGGAGGSGGGAAGAGGAGGAAGAGGVGGSSGGSGGADAGISCVPNAPFCLGKVAATCNSTGDGISGAASDCSLTGEVCLDGDCDPDVTGLVAYWRFDETSGAVAHDSSGNGYDATITGATWISGKVGGAITFDGVDDFASPGNVLDGLSIPFSVSAWIWVPVVSPNWFITSDDDTSDSVYRGFAFGLVSNRLNGLIGDNTCSCLTGRLQRAGTTTVTADVWTHVVLAVSQSTSDAGGSPFMSVILGGTNDNGGVSGTATSMVHTSAPLVIGRGRNVFFNGRLDELRIYDKALNSTEISKLKAHQ